MVNEIRIYVEGGGDQRWGKAAIREGFSKFLSSVRERARERRIHWNIIACGPRNAAFDAFQIALRQHVQAFNILLIDAEGPVSQTPLAHLQQRDGWPLPLIPDDHFHLMVQAMEAWVIADLDALARFYGQGFNPNPIPRQHDVEMVDKISLEQDLQLATRDTQKGEYHKIRHGPKILALIDVAKVRSRARHCERLFSFLMGKLDETIQ